MRNYGPLVCLILLLVVIPGGLLQAKPKANEPKKTEAKKTEAKTAEPKLNQSGDSFPAEDYVAECVAQGRIADLSGRPRRQDRRLRANFLGNFLRETAANAPPGGIGWFELRGAIIDDGVVELDALHFPGGLGFTDCKFRHGLNLDFAEVEGEFVLDRCDFGGLRLRGAELRRSFCLTACRLPVVKKFQDAADLRDLHVGQDFMITDCAGGWGADFAHIDGDVTMSNCDFRGMLVLRGAQIKKSLLIKSCEVTNLLDFADFREMHVGQDVQVEACFDSGAFFSDVVIGGTAQMGSYFSQGLNFDGASIHSALDLTGSFFPELRAHLFCSAVEVHGLVNLSGVTFHGGVDFAWANLPGGLLADGAAFLGNTIPGFKVDGFSITMQDAAVSTISLRGARFEGGADFARLHATNNVSFERAAFLCPENLVDLSFVHIDGDLSLRGAQIYSRLDLARCVVGQGLTLAESDVISLPAVVLDVQGLVLETSVLSPHLLAWWGAFFDYDVARMQTAAWNLRPYTPRMLTWDFNLYQAAVKGDLVLEKARFWGSASFHHLSVERHVRADELQVFGASIVDLSRVSCAGEFRLQEGKLCGRFDLSHLKVTGDLQLDDTHLFSLGSYFSLAHAAVQGDVLAGGTQFECPVSFSACEVAGNFDAYKIKTIGPAVLSLEMSSIKGDLRIDEGDFGGPVYGPGLKVGRTLNCVKATFRKGADFRAIDVGESFWAEEAKFLENGVNLDTTTIQGALGFKKTTFAGDVSFANGKASRLIFTDLQCAGPDGQLGKLDFSDVTYQSLEVKGTSGPICNALDFLARADFSRSNYVALEENLKKSGDTETAKAVYLAGQRRARAERAKGSGILLHTGLWLEWFFDISVSYGRDWELLILYAFGVWLMGVLIFDREHMRPADPSAGWPYSRLWYSAALLMPLATLRITSDWLPKTSGKAGHARWHYAMIHQYAGWFLLTLTVAAFVAAFTK